MTPMSRCLLSIATLFVAATIAPGSACSIAFGDGLVDREPGSIGSLMLVVDDIEQAHAELSGRGVPVSDIDDQVWGRFVYFADPDGNGWTVQQLPARS